MSGGDEDYVFDDESGEWMPASQLAAKQAAANAVEVRDAVGNVRSVFFPVDDKDSTLIGLNYVETDTMRSFVSPERKLERIWMPKAQGTLYPMTQIPPGKDKLDVFAWFDYIRPKDKDDVFNWRGKASGTELKHIKRHAAPIQQIGNKAGSQKAQAPAPATTEAKGHQAPPPKRAARSRKR